MLTIADPNRVLHCLAHQSNVDLQEQTFENEDEHHVGDHVIAYWLEGNSADFFLGVIEDIQADKIFVSTWCVLILLEQHGSFQRLLNC